MKQFWGTSDHLVLAVSTGIDSMVLLHQLIDQYAHTYRQLTCLHVHHGLRDASDNEAQFLEAYCKQRDIPLFIHHLDLTETVSAGRSIQHESRALRYAWFDEMMRYLKADYLLTAHHHDDQLETIFYRVFTGRIDRSSLGILPQEQRGAYRLVRPFLAVTKAHIKAYQQHHNVPFFEDESNASNNYVRNDIRNRILPEITRNPHLQAGHLQKLMDFHNEALILVGQQAQQFLEQHVRQFQAQHWYISRKDFNALLSHVKMCVLDEVLGNFEAVVSVSERTYQDWFMKLSSDVAQCTLMHTNEWHVDIVYDKLIIVPAHEDMPLIPQTIEMAGCYQFGSYRIILEDALFDLHTSVHIRSRQAGDRITLYNGQHKKVTRLMIDHKVPQLQREQVPIVVTEKGDILAVGTCYQQTTYKQLIHIQYLGDDINEK
ncbi:tRNA lysidine(34) synthetase TilS [Staphylococcus americanisciuri]|uniref:tRNA(Ile)-lysidine synthase n=1 Tax=Staphylococcus americanisciuri TaxID=2973940 RepID=A0ABT2F4C4_9STAP|nr:tRNA lysidine(34) synthetase TilS [Staphylococcus americanisciuri]MCS4487262.1 tRNA lysidine(34) synthetase TilS [Staphylococcus americanisciuri]